MAGTQESVGTETCLFARGVGGPFGTFDYAVVKTHLDESTHAEWLRLCASKDVKSSELLRDIVYLLVHGQTPGEFVANDRRAMLVAEGPNSALHRIGARQ